jgi:hypothetical protein
MRRRVLVPVAAVLLLTGCAPTVSLEPAPHASSVGCAGIVVRLPDAIGSAAKRATDAQGTAAWGVPASITLRCGVDTPAISTTSCTTVAGVDWLLQDRKVDGATWREATTYGRDPGTQVLIGPGAEAPGTVLGDLADPIRAATRVTAQCLSVSGTR